MNMLILRHFADVPVVEGIKFKDVSFALNGNLMLLFQAAESLFNPKDGPVDPHEVFPFRIEFLNQDGTSIAAVSGAAPRLFQVQELPDQDLLFYGMERTRTGTNTYIMNSSGTFTRDLALDRPINQMNTLPNGSFWVAYADQAIFGSGVGKGGLVKFNADGFVEWSFNSSRKNYDLGLISDCEAMNVVSESDIWFWYYTDHHLVHLRNETLVGVWRDLDEISGLHGSTSFALHEMNALFSGGYHAKHQLVMVNLDTLHHQDLLPCRPDGEPLQDFRSRARGSKMVLWDQSAIYITDLREWDG